MNYIRKIVKRNKSLLKILGFIGVLGLIMGFFVFARIKNEQIILEIKNITTYLNDNHINFILNHLMLVCVLVSGLILGFGLVLIPIVFVFESISLGFMLRIFFEAFKFKGLLFGWLYFLLTKGFYLLLLIFLVKKILNAVKGIIKLFYKGESADTKYILIKNIKAIIIITLMILINDLLVYFLTNKVLGWFLFIIN